MQYRISGGAESIQIRMRNMVHQLESSQSVFLGSVIDLENELAAKDAIANPMPVELRNSVSVEEMADDEGYLLEKGIPEKIWLESLSRHSGLDCRMIHDFSPMNELGLYPLLVTVCVDGKPVVYSIKLWVVPAAD
jgi:hypothetical protein